MDMQTIDSILRAKMKKSKKIFGSRSQDEVWKLVKGIVLDDMNKTPLKSIQQAIALVLETFSLPMIG